MPTLPSLKSPSLMCSTRTTNAMGTTRVTVFLPEQVFFVVRFASISHLIHHGICMSGSRVIAPDISPAVSDNCPVGDPQAARPESKLWWSAAPLPSLRVSPVGQQRHCHTVRSMVTFIFFPSAKLLGQSPSWRSPEAFSCNSPRSRPAPSNCALALIPVMYWARTLTSSRIWVTWAIYSSPATLSESEV